MPMWKVSSGSRPAVITANGIQTHINTTCRPYMQIGEKAITNRAFYCEVSKLAGHTAPMFIGLVLEPEVGEEGLNPNPYLADRPCIYSNPLNAGQKNNSSYVGFMNAGASGFTDASGFVVAPNDDMLVHALGGTILGHSGGTIAASSLDYSRSESSGGQIYRTASYDWENIDGVSRWGGTGASTTVVDTIGFLYDPYEGVMCIYYGSASQPTENWHQRVVLPKGIKARFAVGYVDNLNDYATDSVTEHNVNISINTRGDFLIDKDRTRTAGTLDPYNPTIDPVKSGEPFILTPVAGLVTKELFRANETRSVSPPTWTPVKDLTPKFMEVLPNHNLFFTLTNDRPFGGESLKVMSNAFEPGSVLSLSFFHEGNLNDPTTNIDTIIPPANIKYFGGESVLSSTTLIYDGRLWHMYNKVGLPTQLSSARRFSMSIPTSITNNRELSSTSIFGLDESKQGITLRRGDIIDFRPNINESQSTGKAREDSPIFGIDLLGHIITENTYAVVLNPDDRYSEALKWYNLGDVQYVDHSKLYASMYEAGNNQFYRGHITFGTPGAGSHKLIVSDMALSDLKFRTQNSRDRKIVVAEITMTRMTATQIGGVDPIMWFGFSNAYGLDPTNVTTTLTSHPAADNILCTSNGVDYASKQLMWNSDGEFWNNGVNTNATNYATHSITREASKLAEGDVLTFVMETSSNRTTQGTTDNGINFNKFYVYKNGMLWGGIGSVLTSGSPNLFSPMNQDASHARGLQFVVKTQASSWEIDVNQGDRPFRFRKDLSVDQDSNRINHQGLTSMRGLYFHKNMIPANVLYNAVHSPYANDTYEEFLIDNSPTVDVIATHAASAGFAGTYSINWAQAVVTINVDSDFTLTSAGIYRLSTNPAYSIPNSSFPAGRLYMKTGGTATTLMDDRGMYAIQTIRFKFNGNANTITIDASVDFGSAGITEITSDTTIALENINGDVTGTIKWKSA